MYFVQLRIAPEVTMLFQQNPELKIVVPKHNISGYFLIKNH
jgi:hypothetical protein